MISRNILKAGISHSRHPRKKDIQEIQEQLVSQSNSDVSLWQVVKSFCQSNEIFPRITSCNRRKGWNVSVLLEKVPKYTTLEENHKLR